MSNVQRENELAIAAAFTTAPSLRNVKGALILTHISRLWGFVQNVYVIVLRTIQIASLNRFIKVKFVNEVHPLNRYEILMANFNNSRSFLTFHNNDRVVLWSWKLLHRLMYAILLLIDCKLEYYLIESFKILAVFKYGIFLV